MSTAIKLSRVARSFKTFIEDQASSLACFVQSSYPKALRFVRNLSKFKRSIETTKFAAALLLKLTFSSQPFDFLLSNFPPLVSLPPAFLLSYDSVLSGTSTGSTRTWAHYRRF